MVITQFKSFISLIGRQLSSNQWNSYITSLQNLFEATIPQSLIDERERYLESELMKKQRRDHTSHSGSADSHKKEKSGGSSPSRHELPFNQDACFTKCIVQLMLISTAAETVEKFYDSLSLHVSCGTSCFYFIISLFNM